MPFKLHSADITFCENRECPFKDCQAHPEHIALACMIGGRGAVSISDFRSVCQRYLDWLAIESTNELEG